MPNHEKTHEDDIRRLHAAFDQMQATIDRMARQLEALQRQLDALARRIEPVNAVAHTRLPRPPF